ncbi:MAG: hypothetical protein LBV43_05920 [Prevotella sp.]|jgi:hypothetical protein|nr:hypothetical protein [Prevotella sp.]
MKENTLDKAMRDKKKFFLFFLLILTLLSVLMTCYYLPLPYGHDITFHIKRLDVLMESLRNHTFPIYMDNEVASGYGYPIKFFYSDFLLLPSALIGLFSDALSAYIILIFILTILCGIFTYHAVNIVYKNTYVAALGAILYTFSPYRLLDIYQRAALGETMSFTFLPLVLLGFYYIMNKDYNKWYIFAIGLSLIIFSHVVSTVLTLLTLVIICIFCYKKLIEDPKRLLYLAIAGVAAFFITAYYLFPLIEQYLTNEFYSKNDVFYKMGLDNVRLSSEDLIKGTFNIFPSINDPFLPRIGILFPICIFLRLLLLKSKRTDLMKITDMGVLVSCIYILLVRFLLPWTIPPFSSLTFIVFQWRLFEFCTFFFAIAIGYYLFLLIKSEKFKLISLFIVTLYICLYIFAESANTKAIHGGFDKENNSKNFSSMFNDNWSAEYVPRKVPSIAYIKQRGDSVKTQNSNTIISDFNKKDGITVFHIETNVAEKVELPLFYYKGYNAQIDNKDIPVKESENGLVEISPEKSGNIRVHYTGTFIQKISLPISLIAILVLCVYIYIFHRKKTRQ